MKKKGFTLVELLAVIAILAILVIIALPNIMKLFNNSKRESFTTELKTIAKAAEQQWMTDSMIETSEIVYSKCSDESCTNPLKLSGREQIEYVIKLNKNGKIIEYTASDGSYQYSYSGNGLNIEDIGSVSQVAGLDPADVLTISATPSPSASTSAISFENRQTENEVTVGDEIKIGTEHFYVISSDANETVLLAKYNLLVGDVFEQVDSVWTKVKTMDSSNTEGYGLQSSTARAYDQTNLRVGIVPFCGLAYWDNANCITNNNNGVTCSGTAGLKSSFATATNPEGKTGNYLSNPYPYVYRSEYSTLAPQYIYGSGTSPYGVAQNNGYGIAYYVEPYVQTLKSLGAPSETIGRLLTHEETSALSAEMFGDFAYWLGSAKSRNSQFRVSAGAINSSNPFIASSFGVCPVIVVNTSSL